MKTRSERFREYMARCRNDEDFRLQEAKKHILKQLQDYPSDDKREFGSYNASMRGEIAFLLLMGLRDHQYWSELTTKARIDPKYYDACRYTYAFCRENKVVMPEELKDWVVHALYEGKPRSGKRGPDPMVNEGHDNLIAHQVEIAHKYFGIPLYNKTSPEKTACGLVMECLSELDVHETYETIYKIYKKYR